MTERNRRGGGVTQAYPEERVGVFARRGDSGAVEVVEYSELPVNQATAKGPDGKLLFNWANIAMHFFSVAFLEKVSNACGVDCDTNDQTDSNCMERLYHTTYHTTIYYYIILLYHTYTTIVGYSTCINKLPLIHLK